MAITKNKVLPYIVSICIIGIGSVLIWRRTTAVPMITTFDNRLVKDLTVAEAGEFGGEKLLDARRRYLTNEKVYSGLLMTPVDAQSTSLSASVLGFLTALLEKDGESRKVLASLPSGSREKLEKAISVSIGRLAGMEANQYLSLLDPSVELRLGNLGMLNYMKGRYGLPADVASRPAKEVFSIISRLNIEYADGNFCLKAISWTSPMAIGVLVGVKSETEFSSFLNDNFSREKKELYLGGVVQGYMLLTGPPETWAKFSSGRAIVPRFEMFVIVENKSGDRYPLFFEFAFDATRNTWWLKNLMRTTSIRVMNSPVFVF